MSTPKVLTITLEFEMSERKNHLTRIKAAYDAAVAAAIEAARPELLDDSLKSVTSRMTWDYRWAETSEKHDISAEWEDVEELDE